MCGFLTRVICQTDKKSGQANAKLSHTNVSKNMPEARGRLVIIYLCLYVFKYVCVSLHLCVFVHLLCICAFFVFMDTCISVLVYLCV